MDLLATDFMGEENAASCSKMGLYPVGIGLSNTYRENSPHALITVGLLNAASAGLLIYMALVDLLAPDFMGLKLQRSIKLQMYCLAAVFLGAAGMSIYFGQVGLT
nr:hypothetical protein CRG98_032463 [Ipomoea trifida]